jgi:hypothetical protein
MINSGNLGLAALLTVRLDTAAPPFARARDCVRSMVIRPVAFEGLRGLAAVAVVLGARRAGGGARRGPPDSPFTRRPRIAVETQLVETYFEPALRSVGDRGMGSPPTRGPPVELR